MAIFKPVNCIPYSSTFDISKERPYYFECLIECSNKQQGLNVNGYSLTILDEDNNQVFPASGEPVSHISLISDLKKINTLIGTTDYYRLNSGLNGTYLKFPVVVDDAFIQSVKQYLPGDIGGASLVNNWINISNPSSQILQAGKSYKWIITLFQGVEETTYSSAPQPKKLNSYDMLLTQGEVLGSYADRIHAKPSSEILPDYFIQPMKITGSPNADGSWSSITSKVDEGARVLISAYDYTLGLIYPETGVNGIPSSIIGDGYQNEKVNGFAIYKMSNNPDDMEDTRKVDYFMGMPYKGEGQQAKCYLYWTFLNSAKSQFLTQVIENYEGATTSNSAEINFIDANGAVRSEIEVIDTKTRIVFNTMPVFTTNGEKKDATALTKNSPFNGIYSPSSFEDKTTDGKRVLTITWYRTSDANTWGLLGNKLIYDQNSGQNYQGQKFSNVEGDEPNNNIDGVINSAPFRFIPEKPVQIYKNSENSADDINNYGRILYNEKPSGSNSGKLYIKPFSSLQAGQLWVESGATVTNPRHFYIESVNTTLWYITYATNSLCSNIWDENTQKYITASDTSISRQTRYQIKTWFRSSDENLFTVFDEPVIKLEIRGEWKENATKNPRIYFPISPASSFIYGGADGEEIQDFEAGIYKTYFTQGKAKQYYYIPVNQRNIRVIAEYQQNQFVPWKSYQWLLQDESNNIIASSPIGYSGEIEHIFFGLAESVPYTLVLQIEDQTNTIWTKKTKIQLGPANLICELETEAEGAGIKTNLIRDIAAVEVQAISQGRVPQNDNQIVEGVWENNNFYNSFGQDIEEDEDVSTFMRRQLRNPMERVQNSDGYCLNIKLTPDQNQEENNYVYYDSVFSSEYSTEPQRELTFEEHFIIESEHVLGGETIDEFFAGEIFGFQIYAPNEDDNFLDYSYVLNDSFVIENGQYIPNPNRGKIILIWNDAELYNSDKRPEDWNKLNYDYYEQNPHNIIAYYKVDSHNNIISSSETAFQRFLCLSQWQPINYERMESDKTNIAPISVPWVLGQTNYNLIVEDIKWQTQTLTYNNLIIDMQDEGIITVRGTGTIQGQQTILLASSVRTQEGEYKIQLDQLAPNKFFLYFVNQENADDTLLCSLDIELYQTIKLADSLYNIYLIIEDEVEGYDFNIHIYYNDAHYRTLEGYLNLYSEDVYEFYKNSYEEGTPVMSINYPFYKEKGSLYRINPSMVQVEYTITDLSSNNNYVDDFSTSPTMVAAGYINNIPILYSSDIAGNINNPDLKEYQMYVGTYMYNGEIYDRWMHREVSVEWENLEQKGSKKYYLTNRIIQEGHFKEGVLQNVIQYHDTLAANLFFDIFVDNNGEVITYQEAIPSSYADRALIQAPGLTINKLGDTYTINGQVEYLSERGENRLVIILDSKNLSKGDYFLSVNTEEKYINDVYLNVRTEDFSSIQTILLGIEDTVSLILNENSNIIFELLTPNQKTFNNFSFSIHLQNDPTQEGMFMTYGHSPVLFTDMQCKVFNVIEHQFGSEKVGSINSNTSGYYRKSNYLDTNMGWRWNESTMGKYGIWRDGDSITNEGDSVNKYSMLKQQKYLPILMAERTELSKCEVSFYVEGLFNTKDYLNPQYDIYTYIYIHERDKEE